jgi:hypothetical protein
MKIGRNDPCPCGSGNKYKKCCAAKDEAARVAEIQATAAKAAEAAAAATAAAEGERTDKEATSPTAAPAAKRAGGRGHVAPPKPRTSASPQPPAIRRKAI